MTAPLDREAMHVCTSWRLISEWTGGRSWECNDCRRVKETTAGPPGTPGTMQRLGEAVAERDALLDENERLRTVLGEIVNASRDQGLSWMCNWMRGRAAAALDTQTADDGEAAPGEPLQSGFKRSADQAGLPPDAQQRVDEKAESSRVARGRAEAASHTAVIGSAPPGDAGEERDG